MTSASLTQWMDQKGITRHGLSKLLGCDTERVYKMADGTSKIPLYMALAIAALNADIDPLP